MGQGQHESAEKTMGNCFVVQFIISVLLTAVLLIWNRDFLMAFGASKNTIEYGVEYMNIYAIGTLFCSDDLGNECVYHCPGLCQNRYVVRAHWSGIQHYPRPHLHLWFQYGGGGCRLGNHSFAGSVLCSGYSFLCGKKTHLKLRLKNLGLSAKIVLPSLALGLSTFIMQASESVISICFNSSLQGLRRGYRRGGHDHSDQRDAVRYASATGLGAKGRSPLSATITAPAIPNG